MDFDKTRAAAAFIRENMEISPYDADEVATLLGYKNGRIVEGFASGAIRLPLDKISSLAEAIGCDRTKLSELVLMSWFNAEIIADLKQTFADDPISPAEQDWISALREFFPDGVQQLTPAMRHRLKLLTRAPLTGSTDK